MPIRCPKCQHERQPWDPPPLDQCPACGIVYEKYQPPPENQQSEEDKADGGTGQAGGAQPVSGGKPAAPPKPTLSTAGIRLPDLGDDVPLDAPPPTNWFWVLAIPVTLLAMAAAIHFQNPGKLLVWLTGSWTEIARSDGFHIELPDTPVRTSVPSGVDVDPGFQDVSLYRADTYGMSLYFAEIRTRAPAPTMLISGKQFGKALAATLLAVDTLETTEVDSMFAGNKPLLWEGTRLEKDDNPFVVEVMATGAGHTLYVVTSVHGPAEYLQENAERILDSITFAH